MTSRSSIHLRSWIAGAIALALGIGLYEFDDWAEGQRTWIIRSLLGGFEVLVMGPGMGVLAMLISEQLLVKERQYQERAAREREERFRFLGKIAASMAHEVRNPLHNIHLLTDELRLGISPAEDLLDRINANIDRLDQATLLIYELAKPQRRIEGDGYGPVDLEPLARSVCQEVESRHDGPARITLTAPPGDIRVLGRVEGLRIILLNLIRNAVEAADGGEVVIAYERAERELRMRITNPGMMDEGMAMEDPDPAAPASRKPGGLGVGLSIARHLAALFGGRITLSSEAGLVATMLFLRIAD